MKTLVKVLPAYHVCDDNYYKIQRKVQDMFTSKIFWLSFTRGSKLYTRMYNTREETFLLSIKYNEYERDTVIEINDSDYKNKYPELFI